MGSMRLMDVESKTSRAINPKIAATHPAPKTAVRVGYV